MVKKIALNFLLLTLSLLIAALIGEGVLRLIMKDDIVLFPRYHTNAHYGEFEIRRFRPDSEFWHTSIDGRWHFQTDARGLRNNQSIPYEKRPGVVRILALGDSHTAGYEVAQDETFAAVLERLFRDDGVEAEVVNAGISGFGTAEELVYLENEGLKFDPDVVVLAFYANDFEDNVKSGLYGLQDGELVVKKRSHVPGVRIQNALYDWTIIRWLSENSYFYSFVFNSVYEIAKASLAAARKEEVQTDYAIATGDIDDYENKLARELIAAVARICADNGITLVIVDIPRPTKSNELLSSIPGDMVAMFESSSDALVLSSDSLSHLAADGVLIHLPNGHRHISAESHRAIAEKIYEYLESRR